MATKNIYWSDQDKQVLALITEHKKEILRKCAIEWGNNLSITASTTGWQSKLLIKHLKSDPNMLQGGLTVGRIIFRDHIKFYHAFPKDWEFAEFAEKYWVKYREIILTKWAKLRKSREMATKTDLMREAIHRGYVSCLDIEEYDAGTWVLYLKDLNMVFEKDYITEKEATASLTRYGLPGTIKLHITKTTKSLK